MTISDRSAVPGPPCPACGVTLRIDWVDVTRLNKPPGSEYLPTGLTCPTDKDHDTQAAWRELNWPGSVGSGLGKRVVRRPEGGFSFFCTVCDGPTSGHPYTYCACTIRVFE